MTENKHDLFCKQLLFWFFGKSSVLTEVNYGMEFNRTDAVVNIKEAPSEFGVLVPFISNRTTLFEFYSNRPTADDLLVCLIKIAEATRRHLANGGDPLKVPTLVVFSTGYPEKASEILDHSNFKKGPHPHIEEFISGGRAKIWIVDTKRISGPGTAMLRFFKNIDVIEKERISLMEALKEEEKLGILNMNHFMEFIMETAKTLNLEDLHNLSAKELREQGKRIALIQIAKRLLGKIDAKLEAIKDNVLLEEEIFLRLANKN